MHPNASSTLWSIHLIKVQVCCCCSHSGYAVFHCAVGAVEDMKMMRDRLVSALEQQGKFKGEIDAALANFHFSQFPMSGVSDQGAQHTAHVHCNSTTSRRCSSLRYQYQYLSDSQICCYTIRHIASSHFEHLSDWYCTWRLQHRSCFLPWNSAAVLLLAPKGRSMSRKS